MPILLLVASSDERFRETIRDSLVNIDGAKIISEYPEVSSNLYIRVLQDLERHPEAALIVDLSADPEAALKALEKVTQAAPDLYVIASNFHADGDTVLASVRGGCRDFLVQPVKRLEFREAMTRLERDAAPRCLRRQPARQSLCISGRIGRRGNHHAGRQLRRRAGAAQETDRAGGSRFHGQRLRHADRRLAQHSLHDVAR